MLNIRLFDIKAILIGILILCWGGNVAAQHPYKTQSVLASGNWYKVAVTSEGVYKMDASFLSSLGLGTNLPSSQLRIYGTGGAMVPEANSTPRVDDLEELAIGVVDGGDGTISGSDYVLFYAPGPNGWIKDSANQRFTHQKNLYTDKTYYYITLGGSGKRVATQAPVSGGAVTVTSFNERYFHELDSVNFLASGKEWYGEEFSNLPGHVTSRTFNVPANNVLTGSPVTLTSFVASRSINVASRFDVLLNNQLVQQLVVPSVTATNNDLFGQFTQLTSTASVTSSTINLTYNYNPGSYNAQGWLNWIDVFYRRQLAMVQGQQLLFRDWVSVGNGTATFRINNADGATQVWDVTDPLNVVQMSTTISGSDLNFNNSVQRLHEYAAFNNTFLTPQAGGKVANQNLHATSPVDMIIVVHPDFMSQAQRLVSFHQQHDNLQMVVATPEQIYNEFSGGNPDPGAIRDYVKMYYDRYHSSWASSSKYLLLFGRASYDYKDRVNNNTNFVPTWESADGYSLNPLATYPSDDFFGFLDDNEDINSNATNTLDIGIGRVPIKNIDEAKSFVDKLIAYHSPAAFGPWRNNATFVADDGDFNLHFNDAEYMVATAAAADPNLNETKIYLDAFKKVGGTAGGTYPDANTAVNNNIYNGALIWNYTGHGGDTRLAEEVIIDQEIVNNWNNVNKLPLFVTATCDFAPFDKPGVNSLGENLLLRPKTGAIALMTTTRIVFASENKLLNQEYLQVALQPNATGRYRTLGEALRDTKNALSNTNSSNNRKFALLGDPAMPIAFPKNRVKATFVNGHAIAIADTLSATEFATIDGEVTDNSGTRLTSFNGTVYLTLFDKPQTLYTLANDPSVNSPAPFQSQTNSIFRGKVTAANGVFQFKFRLPKDINYQYGNGKMSFYAQDSARDATGYSTNVIIGGIVPGTSTDKEGPEIKAYLNDERFVNGSITNQTPILLLKLFDSSGINTGSAGIDHDIVATLDGDNRKYYVLNDFYETDLNSYQRGTVRFQLPEFAPGHHTINIKAWDILNNSREVILDFIVAKNEDLVLDHVLNYPNPFTTKTTFWFEHNKPGIDLRVHVEIYTITGKLIKSILRTINNEGNRSSDIDWDGKDDFGDKIGRGVYLYRITVQSADGKKASKLQRLVSLR